MKMPQLVLSALDPPVDLPEGYSVEVQGDEAFLKRGDVFVKPYRVSDLLPGEIGRDAKLDDLLNTSSLSGYRK